MALRDNAQAYWRGHADGLARTYNARAESEEDTPWYAAGYDQGTMDRAQIALNNAVNAGPFALCGLPAVVI